jgi:hypothetical protein
MASLSSLLKRFWVSKFTPTVIAALIVTGTVAAIGLMMSNVLWYPSVVNNNVIITSPPLGANGTATTWFIGVAKNVSVTVHPQGFVGQAHVVYEADASNITCSNLTLTSKGPNSTFIGCSQGTDAVYLSTNSQTFGGTKAMYWYFFLVFTAPFPSLQLKIYVVQG